jgi:hypothetical protein
MRHSPLPFFSQGLDLMATKAWRANVGWPPASFTVSGVIVSSPFFVFHTAIGDVPACSSRMALQMLDATFETRH